MVRINIICIGKIKENFYRDAIDEYSKRLNRFCDLNIIELPDKTLPDKLNESIKSQIKDAESELIINHLPKDSYKICLDLSGNQFSSVDFAYKIDSIQQYNSSITFVIGGSLGLNDKLKNLCDEKLCFSKMTFPHQLIRVFLVEQLFRAFKISNNEKYHH